MTDSAFVLHPRLAADTFAVGELALCRVLLMNDARFPWLILVPRRPDIREMLDLAPEDQATLCREIDAASRVLKRLIGPYKLNVAAIGNMVPQLHWHIVARFEDDAAWPQPVWGFGTREPYDEDESSGFIGLLQRELGHL
jgi:diadenosine tetraphosphate (Ap4A) HIT family hydrolase